MGEAGSGRQRRKGAKRQRVEARKQAQLQKITQAIQPILQPAERMLCSPARGVFLPWAAFVAKNRVVRGFLAIAAFPLAFAAQGEGIPASFIVTDRRVIVLKRRFRTRTTSVPYTKITSVKTKRLMKGLWTGTTLVDHEVVQVRIGRRDDGALRIWFKEPWLSPEGEAIAIAIEANSPR
jgi:hypothetical protein